MREIEPIEDLERLRQTVRDELVTYYGIHRRPIDDVELDDLASMITAQIDYGFDVRWNPNWVKPGEAHQWSEPPGEADASEREFFIECLSCGRVTAHESPEAADAWYRTHLTGAHA